MRGEVKESGKNMCNHMHLRIVRTSSNPVYIYIYRRCRFRFSFVRLLTTKDCYLELSESILLQIQIQWCFFNILLQQVTL